MKLKELATAPDGPRSLLIQLRCLRASVLFRIVFTGPHPLELALARAYQRHQRIGEAARRRTGGQCDREATGRRRLARSLATMRQLVLDFAARAIEGEHDDGVVHLPVGQLASG